MISYESDGPGPGYIPFEFWESDQGTGDEPGTGTYDSGENSFYDEVLDGLDELHSAGGAELHDAVTGDIELLSDLDHPASRGIKLGPGGEILISWFDGSTTVWS